MYGFCCRWKGAWHKMGTRDTWCLPNRTGDRHKCYCHYKPRWTRYGGAICLETFQLIFWDVGQQWFNSSSRFICFCKNLNFVKKNIMPGLLKSSVNESRRFWSQTGSCYRVTVAACRVVSCRSNWFMVTVTEKAEWQIGATYTWLPTSHKRATLHASYRLQIYTEVTSEGKNS